MDAKVLKSLVKSDEETQAAARIILDVYAEMQGIRQLANQINKENGALMGEVMNLRKDKAALVAFVEENIKDENLKSQILPKQGDK